MGKAIPRLQRSLRAPCAVGLCGSERYCRRAWRVPTPEQIDDAISRQQLVRVHEKQREERSDPGTTDLDPLRPSSHGECAENPEVREPLPNRGVALSAYFKGAVRS